MPSCFTLRDHPGARVIFNLNWAPPTALKPPCDLDIGCLYILADGHRGAVQAAGGNLGASNSAPYIWLAYDDQDGTRDDGETLTMARPEMVAFAVVFAMIYRGVADFGAVGAAMTMTHPGGGGREDRMRGFFVVLSTVAMVTAGTASARADDYVVTIKDHRFTPAEIKVDGPNQRVTITVINEDATAEEFESNPMKVEKVIAGKSKATVRIGPLKPSRYPFIGEYNEATAKGTVIAE